MKEVFLGIDTSNYTTSAAVCSGGNVIASFKMPLNVENNSTGLRQSVALFQHIKALPDLMEKVRKTIGDCSVMAVGVSDRPSSRKDSYMPCFLAGVAAASSASAALGVPLYRFTHQLGHIKAAAFSSGLPEELEKEMIAFHVSGGTTDVLHVKNDSVTRIGGTLDLNAGQIVDRVGVQLGLSFPCGPALEDLASKSSYKKASCHVNGFSCNLSGLENMSQKMISDGYSHEDVAAFIILSVCKTLDKIISNIKSAPEYRDLPLLLAGGVMSNKLIKDFIQKKYGAYFAEPIFSSDNAAGVALLCEREYKRAKGIAQ